MITALSNLIVLLAIIIISILLTIIVQLSVIISLFKAKEERKHNILIEFARYIQKFKNKGLYFDCVEREVEAFENQEEQK